MAIEWRLAGWATPEQAREIARKAVAYLGRYIESSDLLYEFELALTEACANVVVHAYSEDLIGSLELRMRLEPFVAVEFEIANWGEPFWGLLEAEPCPGSPEDESGRGLYIMANLVDSFLFTRKGEKNILWMSKRVKDSLWKRRSSSSETASVTSPTAEN